MGVRNFREQTCHCFLNSIYRNLVDTDIKDVFTYRNNGILRGS